MDSRQLGPNSQKPYIDFDPMGFITIKQTIIWGIYLLVFPTIVSKSKAWWLVIGGGFKYILFSPRSLGSHDPIWRAYFSNGLVQPPTSIDFDMFFWDTLPQPQLFVTAFVSVEICEYLSFLNSEVVFIPGNNKIHTRFFRVTLLVVLSGLFRGESWPPFGWSKGHLEEAGRV